MTLGRLVVDMYEAEKLALAFVGPDHEVMVTERLPDVVSHLHSRLVLESDFIVFAVLDKRVMRVGGCDFVGVARTTGAVITLGYGGE